jgi:signal transduction histidine kinase
MVGAAFYFSVKSLHEQEKIGQLKNDFISNMTHELKTPISTVGVAIEAMQNFDVLSSPKRTNEYLNIASNELSRLSILVDKVLKMSQFESAGAPLGKVTISDFDEIIKNVSESMQIQFEKYNATLELNIPDGNYQVEGDKVHLANIIYNLMDNALKYSKEDPKIQILLLEKSEDIILKITDNGIGIPKEYQSKIFDQFFRVPTGNVHNIKGYGLGLNYVSKVVKAHGGKINLRSKESKGTEFTIELPKYV